jgi:hypothetical protein
MTQAPTKKTHAEYKSYEFCFWFTVHLELYLHNGPTRCTVFTLLSYHASTCFGPICSPSSRGRMYNIIIIIYCNCNWISTRWQLYRHICLTPSGSSTVHIYKQNGTYITKRKNWEVRVVLRLRELHPGICLTTEETTRKD